MTTGIDRGFERRLAALINVRERGVLQQGLKGVEKESLRVRPDGRIEHSAHPTALGAALTHPTITTDFSEALLELVTPAFTQSWQLQQYLCDLHQFVYGRLDDQLLWATSMPCFITGDDDIPVAHYGRSNIGRLKEIYRVGLGYRYGRMMQAISGVHFNYSFPAQFWPALAQVMERRDAGQDFVSEQYFSLLRNYRRYGWLVLYLFGASPALCSSFVQGRTHSLRELSPGTLFEPHATSLRMSDLGYRNEHQSGVQISVNSLQDYVRDLTAAVSTPYAPYERIGVKVDGEYRQLNANRLQIENEYYSYIRPKRVTRSGEHPTQALLRGGVEYVEFRALDVSLFDPVGVNQNKLRFLEAFAALCVMKTSEPISHEQQERLDENHVVVAHRGREPGLMLQRAGRPVPLQAWAMELIDSMRGICELLDEGDEQRPYTTALELQQAKVENPDATPSARCLAELRKTGESFSAFALRMSGVYKTYFRELKPLETQLEAQFSAQVEESLAQQQAMEAAPQPQFDRFLADYFAR